MYKTILDKDLAYNIYILGGGGIIPLNFVQVIKKLINFGGDVSIT